MTNYKKPTKKAAAAPKKAAPAKKAAPVKKAAATKKAAPAKKAAQPKVDAVKEVKTVETAPSPVIENKMVKPLEPVKQAKKRSIFGRLFGR
jgi:hypothetical protein